MALIDALWLVDSTFMLELPYLSKMTSNSGQLRKKSIRLFPNLLETDEKGVCSKRRFVRLGTWNRWQPRSVIAKDLREGRDCIDCSHGRCGSWTALRFFSIGGDSARSSSKNKLCTPRSVVNLFVILFNDSLAIFDNFVVPMRSTETKADPDLSRNTNVRRSFSKVRCDQRQGEERKVERQR